MTEPSLETRFVPEGPNGHFLHGSIAEYMAGRLAFLERTVRAYGDVSRYRLGCDVIYLINDPALARAVFADWEHVDNAMTNGWMFLDQSYLAVHGRARTRPRSVVHASICPRAILACHEPMVACVERMLAGFRIGETRDMLAELMRVGVELTSEALVGRPAASWMEPIFGYLSDIQVLGGAYTASPEVRERLELARRREVFETLEATVAALLARLPAEPSANVPALATLLRAKQEGTLSERGVVHELCVLFLSHGSSSLLALSALFVLSRHPEVRDRLEEELHRVLNGRTPAPSDLTELTYLDLVLKETLRLYPPVGLIPRQVVADFDCGPVRIPAGAQIHVSPYLLHRHPRYWDEPERFWPERFDETHADHRPITQGAYLPFGSGIRRCIGDQLALLHVKLLLATLVPRVRLELAPGYQPVFDVSPMGACYPSSVALPMVVERAAVRCARAQRGGAA